MINKKNVLGKSPDELGAKDAVHVAIVSVRAACAITPGRRCGLNEFNEAIPNGKGPGIADPFRKGMISTGDTFWLLMDQRQIATVKHTWDHPSVAFDPPTREVELSKWLLAAAQSVGITYGQLMSACSERVRTGEPVLFPGTMTEDEFEDTDFDYYGAWSEWCEETGYDEFPDYGSACCPEIDYPSDLFHFDHKDAS